MTILDELALYLRPPGQGVYAVSSGKSELEAATQRYLGSSWNSQSSWCQHLEGLLSLENPVVMLAIPSDTGAGIVRGASRGPEAIRQALGTAPVFDVGDVFTVPHFLDDSMLSESQKEESRAVLYPEAPEAQRCQMPVSPISMAQRVYELLLQLNPNIRIALLGGDHTVTWPALHAFLNHKQSELSQIGIVHFDAHTDLSVRRLGVQYCFATWAYHINEQLGRGKRMIQIGIRSSAKPQSHWEETCDVRQIWAHTARELSPEALGQEVVAHLEAQGVQQYYVSNDLDGTDQQWAAACGTPEPNGLTPDHVLAVLEALQQTSWKCFGMDMVELAPGLSLSKELSQQSVQTATSYFQKQLQLMGC